LSLPPQESVGSVGDGLPKAGSLLANPEGD